MSRLEIDTGILSGRTQTFVLKNEKSDTVPAASGVPHGSVFGPILFLIFINDPSDRTESKIMLFAMTRPCIWQCPTFKTLKYYSRVLFAFMSGNCSDTRSSIQVSVLSYM